MATQYCVFLFRKRHGNYFGYRAQFTIHGDMQRSSLGFLELSCSTDYGSHGLRQYSNPALHVVQKCGHQLTRAVLNKRLPSLYQPTLIGPFPYSGGGMHHTSQRLGAWSPDVPTVNRLIFFTTHYLRFLGEKPSADLFLIVCDVAYAWLLVEATTSLALAFDCT